MSEDDHQLLARIDERVKTMQAALQTLVTRTEFLPVKLIAFGLAALVLASTLTFVLGRAFGSAIK